VDNYVLSYEFDFPLNKDDTIRDVRMKLQGQKLDHTVLIGVWTFFNCPLYENESAGFSYDNYEEKNKL
jgi:hypothetical protein